MFCYQCEQSAKSEGCTIKGVCGKEPEVASLQDLLVYLAKGVAQYAFKAGRFGLRDEKIDDYIIKALFSSVTNVNFDAQRLHRFILYGLEIKDLASKLYEKACEESSIKREGLNSSALWIPSSTKIEDLIREGETLSIPNNIESLGKTSAGLLELITYGLKGVAAYLDHAYALGYKDKSLNAMLFEHLDFTTRKTYAKGELLAQALKVGELNYKAMQLLDRAHTESFGCPKPTPVKISPIRGKAILISGHDLKDLEILLKQTDGKGVNIYTHGEMLPAHSYPELNKYSHLVGNYGGAWQDQQKEFAEFPGAILMTTNCIQEPREKYSKKIFTTGLVAWPNIRHLHEKDFSSVIETAISMPGFERDMEEKNITVGFGRHFVISIADKILEAIKKGKLKHIFLVGGCDGAKPGRNYFTDFVQKIPKDCIILTLACGKYRFNKLDFGLLEGLPRLLDIGQCNDAYSALEIATALAEKCNCSIHDLPLSLTLSWYEQKAVAILLTLLHLGIKNIYIGPTLPPFLTKEVMEALKNKFGLQLIDAPSEDLKEILHLDK